MSQISAISWLPVAHLTEHVVTHYVPIVHGWQVTTCDDARAIASVLGEVHPEFLYSPPRLWEEQRAVVLANSDGEIPRGATAAATLERLGLDRVRAAIVDAASCPREVIEFWHELGIPLGEV